MTDRPSRTPLQRLLRALPTLIGLALLVGAGFMATSTAVNNAFRGPRAMLSLIDGAHWVGVAVIQGAVLVALS